MENVVKHIYVSCDPDNTNSVPVSSLIDFIKPYMPDNLKELEELKTLLDPDNVNLNISSAQFCKIMNGWIATIKEQDCNSSADEANSESSLIDKNRSSFESTFFSITSNQLNMSSKSSCTISTNNNTTVAINDSRNLEEEVKKLQHLLHKTTSELELVKQQLISCEEQNELLSADLNKINKTHLKEQSISEELQKSKLENHEIEEEATAAKQKIQNLEKSISKHLKQQETLVAQINQLENENSHLKTKLESNEKSKQSSKKKLTELKETLDLKELEIGDLLQINDELKDRIEENFELVNFYVNENKLLKQRIQALEKFIKEICPDGDILKYQGINLNQSLNNAFNSPKLLKQIASPISPNLSGSIDLRKCHGSSPKSDTSLQNTKIVTSLRSPHKTLKEELSEVPKEDSEEVKRLQEVVKEQKSIKNILWQNMKHLSTDNESLKNYKEGYEDLVSTLQEKDAIIEILKNELEAEKTKNEVAKEDKATEIEISKKTDQTMVEDKGTEIDKLLKHEDKCTGTENSESRLEDKSTGTDSEHEDKSTGTEDPFWNIQSIMETSDPKKTNYAKQQLKLERLLEKQEKIEKELATERSINTSLSLKHQELFEANRKVNENLEFFELKTKKQTDIIKNLIREKRRLAEKIEALEGEMATLNQDVANLRQENKNAASEKLILNQNLQNALSKLAIDTTVITNMKHDNEILLSKCKQIEFKLKEEFVKQLGLKKQLIDLQKTGDRAINQLQKDLAEKDSEIKKLQKLTEINDVKLFISVTNEELGNINAAILKRFNSLFKDELSQNNSVSNIVKEVENLQQHPSNVEEEMSSLTNNVKLVEMLFGIVADKYIFLLNSQLNEFQKNEDEILSLSQSILDEEVGFAKFDENSTDEEDSFTSCYSELSFINKDYLEIIQLQSDSFLDNLELNDEDLRQLSIKEMEEKFTTLALTLTVDFTTSNKRYLNQKEKYNRLILKFFGYLNCSMDLLTRFHLKHGDINKSLKYLALLKSISEDVFKSAVECGILVYEKRTVNCWNLVINYVAALSREKRQIKQNEEIVNAQRSSSPLLNKHYFKSNFLKKIGFYVIVLFLVIVFLLVSLLLYIDRWCPKDGKRVCPLEWILSLFIKKTYLNHL